MSTLISWTKETWNPTTGCSKISAGCANCYAERISHRFNYTSKKWNEANAAENIVLHPERLNQPKRMKEGKRIFVNSMSDLFHPLVPDDFIRQVFDVMHDCPQHIFQVLTKRPERAAKWPGMWTENIWMGTSIENKAVIDRLDILRHCEAQTLFVSFEPLLEDLGLIDLSGIDWAIVGGESGPNFRRMDHAWARNIRNQCRKFGTAFFFKQSSHYYTERGTQLIEQDGTKSTYQEFPNHTIPQPAQQSFL